MPGSITPLPIMLEEEDRKAYETLQAPTSIVIRYGFMRLVAELPYDGQDKPGCGSKIVARTGRGIELAVMLTSTCPNAGCGHSVSRKQMLDYIQNSGGKNYPFTRQGKILRIATVDDLNEQARLDASKPQILKQTRAMIADAELDMKLVDVELLLGGERIIFHYTSKDWVDFRELVKKLATEYQTRIEMHQVNARDEARLVADYEKCGQHCCCRQFLKVLKPVSMRSAKVQKATLDPHKISGRCGRLMCCLRYEDETYESLRKRLPKRQARVMTEDGPGTVVDTQILTQLLLVQLDDTPNRAAYPLENVALITKDNPNPTVPKRAKQDTTEPDPEPIRPQPKPKPAPRDKQPEPKDKPQPQASSGYSNQRAEGADQPAKPRRRRRRRGKGTGEQQQPTQQPSGYQGASDQPPRSQPSGDDPSRPKRRRRRRRGRGRGPQGGGGPEAGSGPGGGPPPSGPPSPPGT